MSQKICEQLEKSPSRRVLSIQSHVVHGYAGNKCSVFPLQLHGFEVDAINSVQFSNHAGYEHVKGQKLTDKELAELYEGLKLNNINDYSHVLTGYCGNVQFLQQIADVVRDLKLRNPQTLFFCDPVMGDNGRYYTPTELMPIYRDLILPLADVLTPNAFELGELTGMKIETEEECIKAIEVLHQKGVKTIVVTSGVTGAQNSESLRCYASIRDDVCWRFTFPRLRGQFVGTGDVFASLLVVWLNEFDGNVSLAVSQVLSSMQHLIKNTSDYAQSQVDANSKATCELRLIQSRKQLLWPGNDDDTKIVVEKI